MEYLYIGHIVNTHGIKGEIKILSDFERKKLVFKKDFNIYIGKNYNHEVINTYRTHKKFDMITLKGLDNINEVLKYKDQLVYVNRLDLKLKSDEYLIQDLIGMRIIYNDKFYGKVQDIYETKGNKILCVQHDKIYYIPYIKDFIKSVKIAKKEIEVERVLELYEI